MLKATSPDVISLPLWNMTPFFRWKVQVRPSAEVSHLSATPGSTPPAVLGKTRVSYRLHREEVLEKSDPTAGSIQVGQEKLILRARFSGGGSGGGGAFVGGTAVGAAVGWGAQAITKPAITTTTTTALRIRKPFIVFLLVERATRT
jgi:hypothetical protein